MDKDTSLSPLAKADVEIGKPLKYSIFDEAGRLLLAEGQTVANAKQLDELSAKGLYSNPRWASTPISKPSFSGATQSIKPQAQNSVKPDEVSPPAVIKTTPEEPAETGASLTMSLQGSTETYKVKLVGTLGKKCFIVSHPMKGDQFALVKEEQLCEFRSFYGVSVYRLSAKIEKVLLAPYPMLILSWPLQSNLESTVVRSARRASVELPAALKLPQAGATEHFRIRNGVIRNISTGGAEFFLNRDVSLPLGSVGSLAFQISMAERKFLLDISVKVVKAPVALPEKLTHGIAFQNVTDEHFAVIHAYVCDRLIHKIESPLYSR